MGGWGRLKKEGSHVYLWLTHVDVWQRPTQYCEATFLQLKIKKFRGREENSLHAGTMLLIFSLSFSFFLSPSLLQPTISYGSGLK